MTLARFARAREIRFPLLSDPDSETIRAYGLLDESARGRTAGIPHPGTLVVDGDGIVRARLFHEGYKQRHSAQEILEAAREIE